MTTSATPPSANEMPAASAAPPTPIAGKPQAPKMKPYSKGMLTTLTPMPTHSGVQASPAARSAAPKMKFMAKATLKMDNQRMLSAASSTVRASSPKMDATAPAYSTPGTVNARPKAIASTKLAIVTRLASR